MLNVTFFFFFIFISQNVIFNYKFTNLCHLITKTLHYNSILSAKSSSFHTVRNISELYEP